jgi:hypothetical protein
VHFCTPALLLPTPLPSVSEASPLLWQALPPPLRRCPARAGPGASAERRAKSAKSKPAFHNAGRGRATHDVTCNFRNRVSELELAACCRIPMATRPGMIQQESLAKSTQNVVRLLAAASSCRGHPSIDPLVPAMRVGDDPTRNRCSMACGGALWLRDRAAPRAPACNAASDCCTKHTLRIALPARLSAAAADNEPAAVSRPAPARSTVRTKRLTPGQTQQHSVAAPSTTIHECRVAASEDRAEIRSATWLQRDAGTRMPVADTKGPKFDTKSEQ